jgi:dephospho-CoA kinase
MNDKNNKIIAFVGLAGSGKTTIIDYITKKGYPKVYFGGVIYEAMRETGIDITPKSQQIFREQIRKNEGNDFVVKRITKQINNLITIGQHRIIADGLYSWTEYQYLKHAFPGELVVIAVVAPRKIRYRRLASRPERPFTESEAIERDYTEIENLEKGGPIAIADFYILNDGDVLKAENQLETILDEINFFS